MNLGPKPSILITPHGLQYLSHRIGRVDGLDRPFLVWGNSSLLWYMTPHVAWEGEFMTIVWLLTTAKFNRNYCDQTEFKERTRGSIWNFMDSSDFIELVLATEFLFIYGLIFCSFCSFIIVIYTFPKPPGSGKVRRIFLCGRGQIGPIYFACFDDGDDHI